MLWDVFGVHVVGRAGGTGGSWRVLAGIGGYWRVLDVRAGPGGRAWWIDKACGIGALALAMLVKRFSSRTTRPCYQFPIRTAIRWQKGFIESNTHMLANSSC